MPHPAIVTHISTIVVRWSCSPPWAPNAIAANDTPNRTVSSAPTLARGAATVGSPVRGAGGAAGGVLTETTGDDTGPPGEHGSQQGRGRQQDQGDEQGVGDRAAVVRGEPRGARRDLPAAAEADRRAAPAGRLVDRGLLGRILWVGVRLLDAGRVRGSDEVRVAGGRPAPAAADTAAGATGAPGVVEARVVERPAAVGVLVDVRRDLALRLLDVLARVAAVERPVDAVGEDLVGVVGALDAVR